MYVCVILKFVSVIKGVTFMVTTVTMPYYMCVVTLSLPMVTQVLASRVGKEVQLPLRLTEGELLSRGSILKPHLLLTGSVDFQCQGCRGPIIHL